MLATAPVASAARAAIVEAASIAPALKATISLRIVLILVLEGPPDKA
jgi:hypothetical protein